MEFDWSPLCISLRTSLLATAAAFVLGMLAAWMVSGMKGRLRGLVDGIFTLPLVLPPTVLGFILLVLLGRNSPLGQFLLTLGVRLIFSWESTVIAAAVVAFPLVYRTLRGALEQVDPVVVQAARTLGLGEATIFFRIMMPLAWPGAVGGAVLGFARALGEFGATLMVAGNIPGRTQTIPVAIWFASEAGDMGLATTWVLMIMGISLVMVMALNLGPGRLDGKGAGHGH